MPRENKENVCIANIFTMCLIFYVRWITITTCSFMLQHISTTRSHNYVNLPMLLYTSNVASVVVTLMLKIVST